MTSSNGSAPASAVRPTAGFRNFLVPHGPNLIGRLDAFEWKVPVGRLQPLIEQEPQAHIEDDVQEIEIADVPAAKLEPLISPAPPTAPSRSVAVVPIVQPVAEAALPVTARARGLATDNLPAPPDDPGVKPEYVNGKPKSRFRLF